MEKMSVVCAVALCAVLWGFGAFAATYYVAPELTGGSDAKAGTEEAPFATIANALAQTDVTEIIVAAGTYVQTATLKLNKAVTVRGATGNSADVVLDGGSGSTWVSHLIEIGHESAIVKDIRLTRAGANKSVSGGHGKGSGVYFKAAGRLQNCVIDNCLPAHNSGNLASGVYLDQGGTVIDCVISNCQSASPGEISGVAVYINNGTLENTLICDTKRKDYADSINDTTGAVYLKKGAVIGCTITANTLSHAALVVNNSANCLVLDSIVWGNTALRDGGAGRPNVTIGANAVVSNLCTTAAIGKNPIVQNPCFANAAAGDYSLLPGSPCIGSGTDGRDLGYLPFEEVKNALGFDITATEGLSSLEATVSLVASGVYSLNDASVTWVSPADATGTSFTKTFGPGRHTLSATVTVNGEQIPVRLENALVVKPTGDMYVDAASTNPVFPYATPETAATTLEDALDLVGDGLTVHVAEGTYKPTKAILLADAVKVIASGEREKTMIDANHKCRHFSICHSEALVAGLWLEKGSASRGAGSVYISGTGGTVSNCVINGGKISNQNVCDGGGVWMNSAAALVTHSVIMNCTTATTGKGVGVLLDYGTLANSLVVSNSVGETYQSNAASPGGGVYMGKATADAKIVNCTIAHNAANQGGGIYRVQNGGRVVNTIVYDNTAKSEQNEQGDIYVVPYTENEKETNKTRPEKTWFTHVCTSSAIGTNCQVAKAAPYDLPTYELNASSGSTCIDKGLNEEVFSATDLTGVTPRIVNDVVDIGAYEYAQTGVVPGIIVSAAKALFGSEITFTATVQGADLADCICTWYLDGSSVGEDSTYRTTELAIGQHTLQLQIEVGGKTYEHTESVEIYPRDLYVDLNGSGIAPYQTVETAATNIADAVALQMKGMHIHIGAGSYAITNALAITSDITLDGVGMEKTIVYVEGEKVSRVFEINSANALVRYLTVSNGCANLAQHGNNVTISGNGGTIEECRIIGGRNNGRESSGGGIYLTGVGACCRRCEIVNNRTPLSSSSTRFPLSENGGGVYVRDGARLESCLIRGNVANYNGGGVYSEFGIVRNCTIVGNRSHQHPETADLSAPARYGAGLFWFKPVNGTRPDHALINNIVVGNFVSNVVDYSVSELNCGVSELAEESKFENTCSPDEIGSNCITADPCFRNAAEGDYRLEGDSPCRKAGLYMDWMADAKDFFGNPRAVSHRYVTIGCHQHGPLGFLMIIR